MLAATVLLAVLVSRAPFNANVGVDEAFYLVVGRPWLHGTPPYGGSFDVKPPLLFLLMRGAEALFGPGLWAAKALATASAALTACGLYLFGRRFIGELAGAAAAILYLVLTLNLGGTFSPAELLMAPFTTFGMRSACRRCSTARGENGLKTLLWL
jgi:4-amino-4-deoxy-L-arabinose transferase-like glycosyltransferase